MRRHTERMCARLWASSIGSGHPGHTESIAISNAILVLYGAAVSIYGTRR